MSRVIIAAAGTGKTTSIATDIAFHPGARVLAVTYTNNGARELENAIAKEIGHLPKNVVVMTWYPFLMEHLIRPYQNSCGEFRVREFDFILDPPRFAPERNSKYYLTPAQKLYSDRAAQFAVKCVRTSEGKPILRLKSMFDRVFIDECQDLAGWDWELVELLLMSGIDLCLVGDPRQSTFRTNNATKNKHLSGRSLVSLFADWRRRNLCELQELNRCHRSNQMICEVSNSIFPEMSKVSSSRTVLTGHDGVFLVHPDHVSEYCERFRPAVLRHDKRAHCFGHEAQAINWGLSKGLTFDRTLIIPTKVVERHLERGFDKMKSPYGFYVALTRAKYSAAIVTSVKTSRLGISIYCSEAANVAQSLS